MSDLFRSTVVFSLFFLLVGCGGGSTGASNNLTSETSLLTQMVSTPPVITTQISPATASAIIANEPSECSSVYIGEVVTRPGVVDVMPGVIFDEENPRIFEMWWLGTLGSSADISLPGSSGFANPTGQDDRILYSYSIDGVNWSEPVTALRGLLGTGGANKPDIMVGSPSMFRYGGITYMFYEAFQNWVEPINLYYNAQTQDTWATPSVNTVGDFTTDKTGYLYSDLMGFAPRFRKAGTHAVYGGFLTYPNGEINHFLYTDEMAATLPPHQVLNNGLPLFYAFDEPSAGTVPLISIWAASAWDTGVKNSESAHPGLPEAGRLGYIYRDLNVEEARNANQNAIHLAFSRGVNLPWEHFTGPGTGGAVYASDNQFTNSYLPATGSLADTSLHPSWNVVQSYGTGYPSVTERNGQAELFVPDTTTGLKKRLRVDIESLLDANAWAVARENSQIVNFDLGSEVSWSDGRDTYDVATLQQPGQVNPVFFPIGWTAENNSTFSQRITAAYASDINDVLTYPDCEGFAPPTSELSRGGGNQKIALWGTFARTPLGHPIDGPDGITTYYFFSSSVDRNDTAVLENPGGVEHSHFADISMSISVIKH